jgi:hypothetical protein
VADNSRDYYKLRAQQERTFAEAAASPAAVAIHLEMAERYSRLALENRDGSPGSAEDRYDDQTFAAAEYDRHEADSQAGLAAAS